MTLRQPRRGGSPGAAPCRFAGRQATATATRSRSRSTTAPTAAATGGPIAAGLTRRRAQFPIRLLSASRRCAAPRPRHRRLQRGGRRLAALPLAVGTAPAADDLQSRPPQPDRRQRHGHVGGPSLRRSRPADDRPNLRWRSGGLIVARGERATIHAALLARKLVLEATDYRGRIGRASATLVIRRPKPLFLRLAVGTPEAPGAGAPPARRLQSCRRCVRISGKRVDADIAQVSARTRMVRVPVQPGRRTLKLRLLLTSHGKATTVALRVPR